MFNVLLKETPQRANSRYHQHSSSAALNEIKNARKEQLRRNRERRKREIQILSQAALKQLSTQNEDVPFLGFTNHNIDTDNNVELNDLETSETSSTLKVKSGQLDSQKPSDSDQSLKRSHKTREIASAPEENEKTKDQPDKKNGKHYCASAPENSKSDDKQQTSTATITITNSANKTHKSQHSIEKIRSNTNSIGETESEKGASAGTPEGNAKTRAESKPEHNRKTEESSCTSTEDESSDLSSDEETVVETCRQRKV